MKLRQYIEANFKHEKYLVGESDGFKRYFVLRTENRYAHSGAPNGSRYYERDLGLAVNLAVEKDGIWVAWNPGWGVDIHYPIDKAPSYLKEGSPIKCEFVGECVNDGSSLADGEQFYPAFNSGGADSVFELLERWWRSGDDE